MKCRFLIQSSEHTHSALFPVPSKEVVSLYQRPGQALYAALLSPFPQDFTFHPVSISHAPRAHAFGTGVSSVETLLLALRYGQKSGCSGL